MVLRGSKLKKTDISPNCKSASMMPTCSLVFRAKLIARLAINVVLPLLPLGLKKAITSEDTSMPLELKVFMAFLSSSPVKGFMR